MSDWRDDPVVSSWQDDPVVEDEPKKKRPGVLDRVQALAAGVNKGALVNLPGLPVDTALNVWDLLKAGTGRAMGAMGAPAGALPELTARAGIPGSSEWFAAKARGAGAGKVIDPNVPGDQASRVLHAAGQAAGFPTPAASAGQAGRFATQAGAGGALAQSLVESGRPEWAPVAGMAPFLPAALSGSNRLSLLSPEQRMAVERGKALGYEFLPSQETGKKWQQNLEAAMREAPSTSGRIEAMEQRNTNLTQRLLAEAQERVGGPTDQGSAGASALAGMKAGVVREEGRTAKAYKDLLQDVTVDLAVARPLLEQQRSKLGRYPEDQQGGKAKLALDNLLGDAGYGRKTRQSRGRPGLVDENADDIMAAVRKLGGINPGDEAVGSLAKAYPFAPNPQLGPVWRNPQAKGPSGTTAGHSLDRMAELLHERGYISSRDALDEVMGKIADSALGIDAHYSLHRQAPATVDPLAAAVEALTAKIGEKNAPPPPRAGFIRDNPEVAGPLAQDLRSSYGSSAQAAFDAGGKLNEGQAYLGMKQAIDAAIAKALPKGKQEQFAQINAKYGYDVMLKAMTPDSQASFLAQLYRGSQDQFYTFLGVADAKAFKDVQRGFVADLLGTAKDAKSGEVSSRRLGKEIAALDPAKTGRADVMKYLGGEAEPLLRDVGRVGAILPDQIGNSGTAQRMWYQSLLRGGGLMTALGAIGGAGAGFGVGGPLGAASGAVAGQFLVPKAIQGAYLSKPMRGLLAGKNRQFGPDEELLRRYGGLLGYSSSL